MGIAAFLDRFHGLSDKLGPAVDTLAILDRAHLDPVCPQGDDLAILWAEHIACEGQDGGKVGRDAGESLAESYYHARAFFERVEFVIIRASDDEGIISLKVAIRKADRIDKFIPSMDVAFHCMDAGL